jgi:hypothetical protein
MVSFTKIKKNVLKSQAVVVCALCVCVGLGGGALAGTYNGDNDVQNVTEAYADRYDGAVDEGAADVVNTNPAANNQNLSGVVNADLAADAKGLSSVADTGLAVEKVAVDASDADLAVDKGAAGKEITQLQSKAGKKESDKKSKKNKAKSKKNKKKSGNSKKYKTKVKATWYTGDVLGFTGSYGKLTDGNTVALNASQRSELGVDKKETVYLDFPGEHEDLSGQYKVMDSGCSSGVVDLFYSSKGSVPKKFKRAGVVRGVKLYRYG